MWCIGGTDCKVGWRVSGMDGKRPLDVGSAPQHNAEPDIDLVQRTHNITSASWWAITSRVDSE